MNKPQILIVDDEPTIRDNIQFVLENEGLSTTQLATGVGVLPLLAERAVDLILLDVGLPDINGFDLLKEIRKLHEIPVILLTARNAELDRVLGLEIGADDYVSKPFSPRELSARVKAVLRRTRVEVALEADTTPGALAVNSSKRQVTFIGQALQLSKQEYAILTTFMRRPGHVFSREQLMTLCWEQPEQSLDRTVDVHIKNLRAKLRAVRHEPDPIVTHRGSGYSLREDL
jgi:two-component system catabolic regulation response regulator CreB